MTMPTRPRLVFVVLFLTGSLIFTIHLRTTASRVFNQYCQAQADQIMLMQDLRGQQLRLESLINPRYMFEHLSFPAEPETGKKKKLR